MASALLWPSFKENYFKIWGSETPAGVSEPLFHSWGLNPVKMQCRSVRRRSGIALLKIIFPLNMPKAHAAGISNRLA